MRNPKPENEGGKVSFSFHYAGNRQFIPIWALTPRNLGTIENSFEFYNFYIQQLVFKYQKKNKCTSSLSLK